MIFCSPQAQVDAIAFRNEELRMQLATLQHMYGREVQLKEQLKVCISGRVWVNICVGGLAHAAGHAAAHVRQGGAAEGAAQGVY